VPSPHWLQLKLKVRTIHHSWNPQMRKWLFSLFGVWIWNNFGIFFRWQLPKSKTYYQKASFGTERFKPPLLRYCIRSILIGRKGVYDSIVYCVFYWAKWICATRAVFELSPRFATKTLISVYALHLQLVIFDLNRMIVMDTQLIVIDQINRDRRWN